MEFAKWVERNNIKPMTVERLKDEELDDIDVLKECAEEDIASLKLEPQAESELISALKCLRVNDNTAEYDLDSWAASHNITEDTVQKLKAGGIQNLQELKVSTKDDFKRFNIKAGQIVKLTKVISEITFAIDDSGTDSLQLLRDSGYNPSFVEKLNGMDIMKLPVTETYIDNSNKVRKCVIGNPKSENAQKNILIVGSTGAGKSTLIDALCNYVFSTRWDENHRFKLIDEHADELQNAAKGKGMSQTEWVTIYALDCSNSNRVSFNVNIIDTPGFGDTRGITRDRFLVDQIEELCNTGSKHGVNSLDAVWFVAKASDARLTLTQRYIFDTTLSLFGKDIGENILLMITFADGANPPVLEAIAAANVPYKNKFLFNNSALFVDNGNSSTVKNMSTFSKILWEMGIESFNDLFKFLQVLSPQAFSLTSEVLKIRRRLRMTLNILENKVRTGLEDLHTLRKEQQIFEDNKKNIEDNKDFEYETTEFYTEQEEIKSKHVTFCMVCKHLCHDNCAIPDDSNKARCVAMNNGVCKECPKRCHWSDHRNTGYHPTFKQVRKSKKVKQTLQGKLELYQKALGIDKEKVNIIDITKTKYQEQQKEVQDDVKECQKNLKRLDEIALKPDPMSEVEYIEQLIQAERSAHQEGWNERVEELLKIKANAELLQKVHTGDQLLK